MFTTVFNRCRISLAHPPYYLTGSLQISCLGCYLTRLAHQITHVRVQLMNGHLTLSSQARKPCHSMPGNHNKRVEVKCYESKTDEISEKMIGSCHFDMFTLCWATISSTVVYSTQSSQSPASFGNSIHFSLHRSLTLDISCHIHI